MSKAARRMAQDSGEMDMTPMIDIVFNLLIFFLVVTDLNQKDLATLTLPIASMAVQDKNDDPDLRIILNVDKYGVIHFKGRNITLDELGTILDDTKQNYELMMRAKGRSGLEDIGGGAQASKLYVLLRADRNTPWQHVQWLMTIMAEQKLYKLQFATKQFRDASYSEEEADLLDAVTQKEFQELAGQEE